MGCRPSEVLEEDEADVELWLMWDEVSATIAERRRKQAELQARAQGGPRRGQR